jgi:hypothetical protein
MPQYILILTGAYKHHDKPTETIHY